MFIFVNIFIFMSALFVEVVNYELLYPVRFLCPTEVPKTTRQALTTYFDYIFILETFLPFSLYPGLYYKNFTAVIYVFS